MIGQGTGVEYGKVDGPLKTTETMFIMETDGLWVVCHPHHFHITVWSVIHTTFTSLGGLSSTPLSHHWVVFHPHHFHTA